MKINSEKSLKAQNIKWLVLLALCDSLFVLLFAVPEVFDSGSLKQATLARGLLATVLPVVVLVLTHVLPHDVKSMLVYWKPLGVLPGCEAFTKHAPSDIRVNMDALKKNVGSFPSEPAEQNSKWYKLYKMVANETEVAEAQKLFLLFRDMATISLFLIVLVPLGLLLSGVGLPRVWVVGVFFVVQYVACALSARWSGIRFVCNVLAIHSIRKVTA